MEVERSFKDEFVRNGHPVFGVALAKLWLGETLHWGHLWGSAAIVVGLVIGLSRQVKAAGRNQSQ